MNNQGKWIITETFKQNGESEIAATPINWVTSGALFWPPDRSKKTLGLKLETCVEPAKKWKSFKNFEILEDGRTYDTFTQALEAQERILTVRDTTAAEDESSNDASSEISDGMVDFNIVAEKMIVNPVDESMPNHKTDFSPISEGTASITAEKPCTSEVNAPLPDENRIPHSSTDNNGLMTILMVQGNSNNLNEDSQKHISDSGQNNQVLEDISQFFVDEETAEKMRASGFEQMEHPGIAPKQDQLNSILSNQITMTNILAQLFVNQQTLQVAMSKLECSVGTLNAVMSQSSPDDFLCLAEFPISSEQTLEDFNLKLKDKMYKNAMASALRFALGSAGMSVQVNVNSIMGKLFNDQLLKDFSALGLRSKKSFCQYKNVQELVWQAISLTFKGQDFKDSVKDILAKMGTFMKYAPQRIAAKERKEAENKEDAEGTVSS